MKRPKSNVDLISRSAENTFLLGETLAGIVQAGDIFLLYGSLGSGKTVLVKGFCYGLGVQEDVTSPSFTIMNIYSGRLPVFHFDFYRLERASNWDELGLEEYLFDDGVCFVEWPDRLENQPFEDAVKIILRHVKPIGQETKDCRKINIGNLSLENVDLSKFQENR